MATAYGVKIIGSGSAVPDGVITNADLERMVDTSDEWIVQRTGIRERRCCDPEKGEGVRWMSRLALERALENAKIDPAELDLVIVATVTGEMRCPSTSCRVANEIGAVNAGAFDVMAACSGYVYAINVAESFIKAGRYKTIGVVGCDALTTITDYTNRKLCVLLGDAAGAVIMTADEDPDRGCLFQKLYADGSHWNDLYIPHKEQDVPEGADWNEVKLHYLQMNGPEVYRFAVSKFQAALREALEAADVSVDELKMIVAHQSNLRILESTRRKLGLSEDKLFVNIDRFGNCSSGSAALVFDELWHDGTIGPGDIIVFIALGGGLTWATSVWRL
ncbi:MAG: ketoacyl-ACP synthase III [Planctomycetes bacterium]|nr:ketoacyl-ACP synthase III [Planctomycetota bacterium]NOG54706.1 ketoacyl-ACP synthase III [Planctomycetota bacterium]